MSVHRCLMIVSRMWIVAVWGIRSSHVPALPQQKSREVLVIGSHGLASKEFMKTNIIAEEKTVPLSLEEFQNMFIDDCASFSTGDFHALKKDANLATTQWRQASSSERVRQITFLRPLRGMKSARATKSQKWIKIDQDACVLMSSTSLKDVPSLGCFAVDESMIVRSNGRHSVHVKVSWEVQWRRNSLLKNLIESNTRSEMTSWLSSYLDHVAQYAATSKSPVLTDDCRKPNDSTFLVRNLKQPNWNRSFQ